MTTIAERLRRQGRREGRREERVNMLRILLEERFGPLSESVLAKIAAASATDWRRWARRIVKSKSLAGTLR